MFETLVIGFLLVIQIVITILLYLSFVRNTKKFTYHNGGRHPSLQDLPTVSICIPARDEDHALADCLSSVIATDYPKLEVLVLDDCSQDATSQIIRGFAHDGVRFIQGKSTPEDWVGKNYAYEALLSQAHGTYVVFMSVDTHIEKDTITKLIGYMLASNSEMVSVVPKRTTEYLSSVVCAPLRVFWQMVLPLSLNVPVGTALWAVRADALNDVGGFASVKTTVFPERKFARRFFDNRSYRFLLADETLMASYTKKWSSQLHTSIRLWSPVLHKSILRSIFVACVHLLLFILPPLAVIWALAHSDPVVLSLGLSGYALILLLTAQYYQKIVGNTSVMTLGLLTLPYVALQEIYLIIYSYYRYRRGTVEWRGRNVCYPRRFRTPD